jgi:hypothetical protein
LEEKKQDGDRKSDVEQEEEEEARKGDEIRLELKKE